MQYDREHRHRDAMELRRELDVIMTVPLVQQDAPAMAAVPVAQVAEAPGQRSAAQRPPPQSSRQGVATARPAAGGTAPDGRAKATPVSRHADTPAAPKSKTPLLLGLGAAAAIGIGAFAMFSGGKQPHARDAVGGSAPPSKPASVASATPKPAASTPPKPKPASSTSLSVSPSTNLPVSKPSDKFPPGQWVKVFTKSEDLPAQFQKAGSGVRLHDGKLEVDSISTYLGLALGAGNMNNCAVRATMLADDLNLSMRGEVLGKVSYLFKTTSIEVGRPATDGRPADFPRLASFSAPPKTEQQWEFGAVGNSLITRRGGVIIGFATDARIKIGMPVLANFQGTLRDIEVINLDGLSEAEALKILGVDKKGNDLRKPAAVAATTSAPSVSKSPPLPVSKPADPKFPPGQWVKVFTKFEDLPESMRRPGAKGEDGWIVPNPQNRLSLTPPEFPNSKNHGIKITYRIESPKLMFSGEVRVRHLGSSGYAMGVVSTSQVSINVFKEIQSTVQKVPLALSPPTEDWKDGTIATLEFFAVGSNLSAWVNGKLVTQVEDSTGNNGKPALLNVMLPFRDIEVINLDGLPEAEALKIIGLDEKGNDLRAAALAAEQEKAEMAQQADAIAAIPELKALHEQFVKLQGERVTAPFEAEVAKLNAGYVGGIDREIANEKKAGHLDGVIALEAEKKLIQGVTTSSRQPSDTRRLEAVAPCPIPAEDDEKTSEALKNLRAIYRDAYAKLEATRAANLKGLTDPLTVRLKALVADLTQQDRVPDAKAVREYREAMEGRVAAPSSATAPPQTAPAGASTPPVGDKSAGVPPSTARQPKIAKPKDAFTEREAAEWVLSFAGKGPASVTVLVPGQGEQPIQSLEQLPKDKFFLRKLTVAPTLEVDRDRITDQEVLRLMGLEDVREINLSHGRLTGVALRALGQMPTLEILRFQGANLTAADLGALENAPYRVLYLYNFFVQDEPALRVFSTMKNLRDLALGGLVTAEMIAAMPILPKLESFLTTVNDRVRDDLLTLLPQKFPALQRIDLWGDAKLQGDTLASMKELKDLINLGINYSQVDDNKLASIADMKRLLNLGIAGTRVTDDCIPTLKTLKSLEVLLIFETQITDAGLLELAELRSLKTLGVRHGDGPPIGPPATGFTQAGLDAFQKKRPDVKVTK